MTLTRNENDLSAMKERYVPRGIFTAAPFFLERGDGALLYDTEGKRYIDFVSGIGVTNLGHGHKGILDAIAEQAKSFLHACSHVIMYEKYVLLAKALSELLPGENKALFVNSGAEAVENAVKIARHATGRKSVICFEGGFHGRTLLALSLTSKIQPYKQGFGPFAPEIYRFPYAYPYRCPVDHVPGRETGRAGEGAHDAADRQDVGSAASDRRSHDAAECGRFWARKVREAFVHSVDPKDVACIVVEPVQGEGGFVVPPPEFLQELQTIAKEHGIVLILDEVQAGLGRTGKMFAFEHAGIQPDLVVLAKALGGGLPLGAVLGRRDLMDAPQVGGLGGTFGGNPLACAAALKVVDLLKEGTLLEQASRVGEILARRLTRLKERYPIVGDVRGIGAMAAIELVNDRATKEPAKDETKRVLAYCLGRGLLLFKAGMYDNVIRILTPLTIEETLLEEGLAILEEGVKNL